MEYVDPHHKRTDFTADSFSLSGDHGSRRISFVGKGQHGSVVLFQRGTSVIAMVPEAENDFVLWKAQILPDRWLTLDFEKNPLLSRILIHADRLDVDGLDAALRSLIGTRSVLYYRRDE